MTANDKSSIREQHPEIAAIVDEIRAAGGTVTAAAVYDHDGNLLAGRIPPDPPGAVWVSAESYIKMRAYGAAPDTPTQMPRSKR